MQILVPEGLQPQPCRRKGVRAVGEGYVVTLPRGQYGGAGGKEELEAQIPANTILAVLCGPALNLSPSRTKRKIPDTSQLRDSQRYTRPPHNSQGHQIQGEPEKLSQPRT